MHFGWQLICSMYERECNSPDRVNTNGTEAKGDPYYKGCLDETSCCSCEDHAGMYMYVHGYVHCIWVFLLL